MVAYAQRTGRDTFLARYAGVGTWQGPAVGGGGQVSVRFVWTDSGAPTAIDRLPSSSYPDCPEPDFTKKHIRAHTQGRTTCFY
jgi:hypothetical protein